MTHLVDGDKAQILVGSHHFVRGSLADNLCGQARGIRQDFAGVLRAPVISGDEHGQNFSMNAVHTTFSCKLHPEPTDSYPNDPFLHLHLTLLARIDEQMTRTAVDLVFLLSAWAAASGSLVVRTEKRPGKTSHQITDELPGDWSAALIQAMLTRGREVLATSKNSQPYALPNRLQPEAYREVVAGLPDAAPYPSTERILRDGGKSVRVLHEQYLKIYSHVLSVLGYAEV